MTGDTSPDASSQYPLLLKIPEQEVDQCDPWSDDELGRKEVAAKLTNLVKVQRDPFVIGIDGYWGTGKTFFLKRWQAELGGNFRAIYFNAWEDDIHDDPLLAIIGQLSEHFYREDKFKDKVQSLFQAAIPLVRKNVTNIATGLLEKHVGVSGLVLDVEKEEVTDFLAEYLKSRETRDQLKQRLGELSEVVLEDTSRPLVFIIDELDRCRPTFAIELLERVKHIFDIPNLVFVFGINRDELSSSLRSVYGDIDADVYLRRFFDMEFVLPVAPVASFCRYLMDQFGLREHFYQLPNVRGVSYASEIDEFYDRVPVLWSRLHLSLRDINYCVRSIALLSRNLEPRDHMFPLLLGLLVALKLKNPHLYTQLVNRECRAADVIDYMHHIISPEGVIYAEEDWNFRDMLDTVESMLYRTETDTTTFNPRALPELEVLLTSKTPPREELPPTRYLSKLTLSSHPGRIEELITSVRGGPQQVVHPDTITHLARLIDLHTEIVRR
ncbi:MAG: hypothetical protein F4Y49_08805 [Dehalococcoidia bacterium]|nr:hypothetical protein [Dehalococcoidia bacterium]